MNVFNKNGRGERLYMLIVIFIILLTLITLTNHINQQPPVNLASSAAKLELVRTTTSMNNGQSFPHSAPVEIISQHEKLADVGLDYSLLQALLNEIKFDEHNHLLLTDETRLQLDTAVALIGFERGAYELSQLNNAINAYLPDVKGQQVNDLLTRYFQYKVAEYDFLQAREATSIEDSENNYSALRTMRKSYLGDGVATQLFSQEEAYMEYTMAVMALDQDSTLSVNEREQRMAKLQVAYPSVGVGAEP